MFRIGNAPERGHVYDVLWGRVRPSAVQTKVQILASSRKGKRPNGYVSPTRSKSIKPI